MNKRYIDPEKIDFRLGALESDGEILIPISAVRAAIAAAPSEDVVKVVRCEDCRHLNKQGEGEWADAAIEQIIRKKAEVSNYWQKDVKKYRTMQGYSDIEQDVDNFLRGYGEAVEDIIAILDGMKGGE